MFGLVSKAKYDAVLARLVKAQKTMRNCQGAIESGQLIDKDVHGNLKRQQMALKEYINSL